MINKFQQGGMAPQQSGSILQLIQLLPQDQLQLLMQAFTQWAQLKGVDIQLLLQNPQALEQALGQFMQEMQAQQTQAAKHGAKLQFIKKLKHQCAEDEELRYFAKGGAIGCNCVKKEQKGGKTEPKKNALQQFKDKKKQQPPIRTKAEQDSINKKSEEDYFKGYADHTKPGTKPLKKGECGGKMKKHQIGGTLETLRQSLGLEKKNLSKFQNGGELPTAPKAEDRYKDSYKSWNWPLYKEVTAGSILFPGAKISLTIEGSDTTYMETPSRFPFVNVVSRVAKNNAKTIKWRDLITGQTYPEIRRGNSREYETLKRRFNTAWNLAK